MKRFLSGGNLAGKKMAFFTTHEGWPGKGLSHMASLAKKGKAEVQGKELAVRFSGSHQVIPAEEVRSWAADVSE